MKFNLEYKSKPIPLVIHSDSEHPQNFDLGGITLSEFYEFNEKDGGSYQVVLSKEVNRTSRTIDKEAEEMAQICLKINLLSIYAFGRPLNMISSGIFNLNFKLRMEGEVVGWETNKGEITQSSSFGPSRLTIELNTSPLSDIATLVQNADKFSSEYLELIQLHNNSLMVVNDTGFMIISKALEIVKELFNNKGSKKEIKKEFKALPEVIKDKFKDKDINWLYEISNRRLETRHAILNKQNITLHRSLTVEERVLFSTLSHTLITYYIRKKNGLSPIMINL